MSSANKTLKTSDVTIVPYQTNKTYSIDYSQTVPKGIRYYIGKNGTQTVTGSIPQTLINYRSIRQLYYSNYLDSIAPTQPLSEQNYNRLEEDQNNLKDYDSALFYDNFVNSTAASGSLYLDNRFNFPTGSDATIGILSIPQNLFGENLKGSSFLVTSSVYRIVDDGNGNVYDELSTPPNIHVGNILYSHGIVVITNPDYLEIFSSETCTSPYDIIGQIITTRTACNGFLTVEDFLKYAEAVGLTESAAVP